MCGWNDRLFEYGSLGVLSSIGWVGYVVCPSMFRFEVFGNNIDIRLNIGILSSIGGGMVCWDYVS